MPYVKPGVEITQVEKSQSPVLITPKLEAVVMGTPYRWVDPRGLEVTNLVASEASLTLTIAATDTVPTVDLPTLFGVTAEDILEDTIVIDLVQSKVIDGVKPNIRLHTTTTDFSVASGVITLDDGAGDLVTADGLTYTLVAAEEYEIRIGFMAVKPSGFGFKNLTNAYDIEEALGEPKSWNALGYGALIAQQNSGTAINSYGYTNTSDAATEVPNLELEEVYAMATMEHDNANAVIMGAHCVTQSGPTLKKERICFVNLDNSVAIAAAVDSATRATSATTIAAGSNALGDKRTFATYPTTGYITETRHVSTVRPDWLIASFADFSAVPMAAPTAQLLVKTVGATATYLANTPITYTIWKDLVAAGWGAGTKGVSVRVPIPGYYYNAAAAGQAIGVAVEQPMTNKAIGSIERVIGGTEKFTEVNLNTMAEGGTFIFVQDSPNSAIYCRHQLSTDITTIERQELSITRQADYAAKYFRKLLKKYAGVFNITPAFLGLVKANLTGGGASLVKSGAIAAVSIGRIYQDEISPDTVRAEVTITIKYPANYIKIDLIV